MKYRVCEGLDNTGDPCWKVQVKLMFRWVTIRSCYDKDAAISRLRVLLHPKIITSIEDGSNL